MRYWIRKEGPANARTVVENVKMAKTRTECERDRGIVYHAARCEIRAQGLGRGMAICDQSGAKFRPAASDAHPHRAGPVPVLYREEREFEEYHGENNVTMSCVLQILAVRAEEFRPNRPAMRPMVAEVLALARCAVRTIARKTRRRRWSGQRRNWARLENVARQ